LAGLGCSTCGAGRPPTRPWSRNISSTSRPGLACERCRARPSCRSCSPARGAGHPTGVGGRRGHFLRATRRRFGHSQALWASTRAPSETGMLAWSISPGGRDGSPDPGYQRTVELVCSVRQYGRRAYWRWWCDWGIEATAGFLPQCRGKAGGPTALAGGEVPLGAARRGTPWRRREERRGRRRRCWRARRLRCHWAPGLPRHACLSARLFGEELVDV